MRALTPAATISRVCSVLLVLLVVSLCLVTLAGTPARAANDNYAFTRPQVLVLVLGGMGPADMCSINYDSVVPLPKAQSELDAMRAAGKWQVRDAKSVTKSSGGPNAVPTTGISFSSPGLIGYTDGTLPLEPYLIGLKRLKFIEVDFITPSGFVFHGLKDFENNFVKIQLSQNGNSYRYRVVVKDPSFTKLDLPLRAPEKPKSGVSGGSPGRRILIAISLAVLAAVAVYFVMAYISKRR